MKSKTLIINFKMMRLFNFILIFSFLFSGVLNAQKPGETKDTTAPEHEGDWHPILVAPTKEVIKDNNATLKNVRLLPTEAQIAYQEAQLGAFIHFSIATYVEDFMKTPDITLFNPEALDAEQWIRTAKSFGAKYVVLTVKHHSGFCLWPTNTVNYSVKNSPWKEGKGDIVAEFVAACRKYDVTPGLYVSGGDKYVNCYSTPEGIYERHIVGDRESYFITFLEQLKELATNYGDIGLFWFDGAYDPFGWDVMDANGENPLGTSYGDAIHDFVKALQPNTLIFQGTQPDIRWSGSEAGWAPYPLWYNVTEGTQIENWVGYHHLGWTPPEANIHVRSSWFWQPNSDHTLKSAEELIDVYDNTIGRGANILINMTPDVSGLIPETEVQRFKDYGMALEKRFANPIAKLDDPVESAMIELKWNKKKEVSMIEIEEDYTKGQKVLEYTIEYLQNDKWVSVAKGVSIGRKRIQKFNPVKTNKIRLKVEKATEIPTIRKFVAY